MIIERPEIETEGVFSWARSMARALQEYIESSYHLRDEGLIAERKALLETPGIIFQEPYIEATPSYRADRTFAHLSIDQSVKELLVAAGQEAGVSVFDPPYSHQAEALEAVLNEDDDLIVSTGTGSGKTETFLLPIISALYSEALQKPELCELDGARAIVLYPMNALVNDQLFRLRRLLYKSELAASLSKARGRRVRFAAYTGRMPYPGQRESSKDTRYIAPLFEEFYLPLLRNGDKKDLLESGGRWPAKDLEKFYRADLRENVFRQRRGEKREENLYHWDKRLITQPDDAELFARHEVLKACPDILITNYSMLEYMLIRPIERSIFEQTKQWLHSDNANRLSLVIDEAHLYRGAAGAEIAMLIRRLMARLDASRDQIRCIITSASIGEGVTGVRDACRFAEELTGAPKERKFRFIGSSLDLPAAHGVLARRDQQILAGCDIAAIRRAAESDKSCEEVAAIANALGWGTVLSDQPLSEYLYDNLVAWPPVGSLITQVSSAGTASSELIKLVAGTDDEVSATAVAVLLEICSLAKRDGRVLLPARMHLFFRGLPGIWACVNADCDARRSVTDASYPMGKFFDAPRGACDCTRHARVFELLSHRGCGAAFIQAYVDSQEGEFLWSEGGELPDDVTRKLVRVELLMDGDPHPDFPVTAYERAALDVVSGKLFRGEQYGTSGGKAGYRTVVLPSGPNKNGDLAFSACPVCQVRWRESSDGHSQIERHNTRGENPFVAVLREQLEKQPAPKLRQDQESELERYPNRGKKSLVFSDGRQRAARLARVVPDVIEQDAFRQTLCRAVALRSPDTLEARLDSKLYTCFVKACADSNVAMFSSSSRLTLRQQMRDRREWEVDDLLEEPLEDRVSGYAKKLYWALSDPYYSVHVLGIGYVLAAKQVARRVADDIAKLDNGFISKNIESLTVMWIRSALREYVFDKNIDTFYRQVVSHTPKAVFGSDGKFAPTLRQRLLESNTASEEDLTAAEAVFAKHFMETAWGDNLFLKPDALALRVAVDDSWYRCSACQACHPVAIEGRCAECFWPDVDEVGPRSPYMVSRKDLWRRSIRRTIRGEEHPATFLAAEHTAQLSHRDRAAAHATTELHELRFQDILIRPDDEPIDVLSCTTTMEVGIDIGSLVAVAMRNIPPERSNYQQRAGRAGRRGSGISTVLAFAELMPHDAYYFANPDKIVRGTPRTPEIKISNPKIARRHVHAYVFQRFFASLVDQGVDTLQNLRGLSESFGPTERFFHDPTYAAGLNVFKEWVKAELQSAIIVNEIARWIPTLDINVEPNSWIAATCHDLLATLDECKERAPAPAREDATQEEDTEDATAVTRKVPRYLLDYLADSGLLPTYALPRHVAAFLIEECRVRNGYQQVRVKEMPQQELRKALSEYAPGRIVTINGEDYRSGAVTASTPFNVKDRAKRLFDESQHLLTCSVCEFVRIVGGKEAAVCPICQNALVAVEMIEPEVFLPDDMKGVPDNDRAQERTYATGAQLPLPADEDHLPPFDSLGYGISCTYAKSQELVTLNRGPVRGHQHAGFYVCELCGQTEMDSPSGRHNRAYQIEGPSARGTSCNGRHKNVFLGQIFRTDLMVLRVALKPPVISNINSGFERYLLHSAFETISQALIIAASRHRALDVDAQEFGSGYRFLPNNSGTLFADIYLYDTLEGGAGFADIAATHVDEIIADMIHLLESCPGSCARSCTRCLRHFKNQHVTSRLDRRLGASLLRYAVHGPEGLDQIDSADELWTAVARLLEMDGLTVEGVDHGIRVRGSAGSIDVFGYKPILQDQIGQQYVMRRYGSSVLAVSEISLLMDPPNVHAAIRGRL